MQAIALVLNRLHLGQWSLLIGLLLSSCQPGSSPPQRVVNIQQKWELEPGDRIANHLVIGSLGDISIQLNRQPLRAPFVGKVEPSTVEQCVIYSTPEVPAYLFRFCGLRRPRLGNVKAGQLIGGGSHLQFATLRRQPDGTWIIVEPSTGILERAISERHQSENATPENLDLKQEVSDTSSDKGDPDN